MPEHLLMLNRMRVAMVKKRYPAKLINQISRIYMQGLADSAVGTKKRERNNPGMPEESA